MAESNECITKMKQNYMLYAMQDIRLADHVDFFML